jgi:hypothetical protein
MDVLFFGYVIFQSGAFVCLFGMFYYANKIRVANKKIRKLDKLRSGYIDLQIDIKRR